jgi:hypothetical protein
MPCTKSSCAPRFLIIGQHRRNPAPAACRIIFEWSCHIQRCDGHTCLANAYEPSEMRALKSTDLNLKERAVARAGERLRDLPGTEY